MLPDFFHRRKKQILQQCEDWFLAHRKRLLAYARQQADSTTDVELLLTDTMKRVFKVFCQGGLPEGDLLPYSMRCIRNAAQAARAQNIRRIEAERCFCDEETRLASLKEDSPTEGAATLSALRRAVRELPEGLHAVLTLKLWGGLSFEQVARQLGLPKSTVQRRYAAALNRMRKNVFFK